MVKTAGGQVSAQAQAGEQVKIKIIKPDSSSVDVSATTNQDGSYSATVDLDPGSGYVAQAHIDQDATFMAADSPAVPFDVLVARTITLTVS